jgi:hypothetical protein
MTSQGQGSNGPRRPVIPGMSEDGRLWSEDEEDDRDADPEKDSGAGASAPSHGKGETEEPPRPDGQRPH